jgi:hypothetical protein
VTAAITRRLFLGSATIAATIAASPAAPPFPDSATLLVGGPGGSPADSWAEWLSPGLGRALPPGTQIRKDIVGGADGVTAANQFEARIVPDGSTAMLLPGSAAMASLVGDPRARFDVAHWVPALAGVTPGLVVSRLSVARVMGGFPVRIAAINSTGPELPAMLALELLGAKWEPLFGLSDTAAMDALGQGQVDVVCLHGRRVAEMAQVIGSIGAQPLFSFGCMDEANQRDPAFPGVPAMSELLASRQGDEALRRAWYATAAASDLDVAMVLPQFTPASIVALWRHAATQAMGTATVQAQASALGVRTVAAPAATTTTAAVVADASGQIALRSWLAQRLDYRPG